MKIVFWALTFVVLWAGPARSEQAAGYDDRNRINVTGEALVTVAPDRIVISLGVDTRDINLVPAKQQNDAIVRKALAAIKELSVPDRDIQTDRLSIEQRFESARGTQVFAGYTVRNMFAVTLDDPAKVETVISRALDAGVNYLLGVDFQTTQLKKYREQARELAVRAAREKAEKMAATLGEKVGHAIQINENANASTVSYYSSWSGSGWGTNRNANVGMSQNSVGISGGEVEGTLALGKVGVRANVNVVFELTR